MKILAISFCLVMALSAAFTGAFSSDGSEEATSMPPSVPMPPPPTVSAAAPLDTIYLADRGFSLTPPPLYERIEGQSGITLFLEVPKSKLNPGEYPRTIQAIVGADTISIDNVELERFREKIVQNRSKAFDTDSGYKISKSEITATSSGQPAIIYYAEATAEGIPLMEMHFMVGTKTGYVLLTYTDLTQNFTDSSTDSPLFLAYRSFLSIKVSDPAPGRFDSSIKGLVVLLGASVLWGIVVLFRRRKFKGFDEKFSYTELKTEMPQNLDEDTYENRETGIEIDLESDAESDSSIAFHSDQRPLTNSKISIIEEYDDENEAAPPTILKLKKRSDKKTARSKPDLPEQVSDQPEDDWNDSAYLDDAS